MDMSGNLPAAESPVYELEPHKDGSSRAVMTGQEWVWEVEVGCFCQKYPAAGGKKRKDVKPICTIFTIQLYLKNCSASTIVNTQECSGQMWIKGNLPSEFMSFAAVMDDFLSDNMESSHGDEQNQL